MIRSNTAYPIFDFSIVRYLRSCLRSCLGQSLNPGRSFGLWLCLCLSLVLALCACSPPQSTQNTPSPDKTQGEVRQFDNDVPLASVNYRLDVVAEGLNKPWSFGFLPSGDILINERNGGMRVIRGGILLPEPVKGLPAIYTRSQAGLFDIVPHPDFSQNNLIYFSYAHGTTDKNGTRLARARFVPTPAGGQLEDFEVLFSAQPLKSGSAHYGARIAFLPDRTLLMTIGEGYSFREQAQKLDNHLGKIIRLNDDGSVPPDNPFVDRADALPEIFSYGHRNPQGLVIDQRTGRIYETEHGPKGGDELNIIMAGRNYGWPVITYGIDYSGALISPYKVRDGMEQPEFYWTPSIAASGLALYTGDLFPMWQGDLFAGALALKQVRHIKVKPDGSMGEQEKLFTELENRIRDIRQGPDGALYLTTDHEDGRLIRVSPLEEE